MNLCEMTSLANLRYGSVPALAALRSHTDVAWRACNLPSSRTHPSSDFRVFRVLADVASLGNVVNED